MFASRILGGGYCYFTTRLFSEGLSLCRWRGWLRRNDQDYIVFCFAAPAQAELSMSVVRVWGTVERVI